MNTILKGTDLRVSRLGFGGSGIMGVGKMEARIKLLNAAFEAGVTHFDVARMYGLGKAEVAIGEFMKGKRDKVTVTTKFGIVPESMAEAVVSRGSRPILGKISPKLGAKAFAYFGAREQSRRRRFDLPTAKSELDTSLKSLATDYIDLYLLHAPEEEDIPTPELIEFLDAAKKAGKIRWYGIGAEPGPTRAILDRGFPNMSVIQFENSVMRPNIARFENDAVAKITHRALQESYMKLRGMLITNREATKRLTEEVGQNLKDPIVLSDLMLLYALDTNPDGCVLFSTRKESRLLGNTRLLTNRPYSQDQVMHFSNVIQRKLGIVLGEASKY